MHSHHSIALTNPLRSMVQSRLVTITTQQLEAVVEPAMPGFGREFAENFQYYRDYTYTGGDPKVLR